MLVNLPYTLLRDAELTLTVAYSGRLAPQAPERETIARSASTQRGSDQSSRMIEVDIPTGERSYLYSSRSYWYPQPPISDYATARIRITVPVTLGCVASGELEPGLPVDRCRARSRRAAASCTSSSRRGRSGTSRSSSAGSRAPTASTVAFDDAAAEASRGNRRSRRRRPRWAARSTTA